MLSPSAVHSNLHPLQHPGHLLPTSLCMPLHFVGTKRRSCHRDQTQPIHIILLYYRYLAFSSGSPGTGGERPSTAGEAAGTREPLPADPLPPAWPQRRDRGQQQGGPGCQMATVPLPCAGSWGKSLVPLHPALLPPSRR